MAHSDLLYFTEYGSGLPLLLVHGVMITGAMFEPVIAPLAAHHRLIVPDLRGHGHSRNLPGPYSAPQLASDLARLLDHLGIESTAVLGYSQGGAIAQQFTLDYPQRCKRLVLACTYAFNMATFREKLEGQVAPLLIRGLGIRRFAEIVISQGLKRVPKERAEWVTNLIAGQDARLMEVAWREVLAFDSRKRLGEIKCPTLIIAGAKDEAVPMHHAEMVHTGIPGSPLAVIDEGDHGLIWAQPEALVREVDKFL